MQIILFLFIPTLFTLPVFGYVIKGLFTFEEACNVFAELFILVQLPILITALFFYYESEIKN